MNTQQLICFNAPLLGRIFHALRWYIVLLLFSFFGYIIIGGIWPKLYPLPSIQLEIFILACLIGFLKVPKIEVFDDKVRIKNFFRRCELNYNDYRIESSSYLFWFHGIPLKFIRRLNIYFKGTDILYKTINFSAYTKTRFSSLMNLIEQKQKTEAFEVVRNTRRGEENIWGVNIHEPFIVEAQEHELRWNYNLRFLKRCWYVLIGMFLLFAFTLLTGKRNAEGFELLKIITIATFTLNIMMVLLIYFKSKVPRFSLLKIEMNLIDLKLTTRNETITIPWNDIRKVVMTPTDYKVIDHMRFIQVFTQDDKKKYLYGEENNDALYTAYLVIVDQLRSRLGDERIEFAYR